MSGLPVERNNGSVMHYISPIYGAHNIPLRTRQQRPEPKEQDSKKGTNFLHMFSILLAVLSFVFMIVFMTRGMTGTNGEFHLLKSIKNKDSNIGICNYAI